VQQLVKGMSRTVPVQNFPRPIGEHRLHAFYLPPRHAMELGAGGKELPQQAVRVLVRAPRPGALRMGKVDLHLGLFDKEAVLPHFRDLVIGQRPAEWSWREELNHPTVAGSALKLASPVPAEGGQPPRTLPKKGTHPLRNP